MDQFQEGEISSDRGSLQSSTIFQAQVRSIRTDHIKRSKTNFDFKKSIQAFF